MAAMEDITSQEMYDTVRGLVKPKSLKSFLSQIMDRGRKPPVNEMEATMAIIHHQIAEHVAWWAKESEVIELLDSSDSLKGLVKDLKNAMLALSMVCQQIDEHRTCAFHCLGCNTPYEHSGHDHKRNGQPLLKFGSKWDASTHPQHGPMHMTTCLLAVVASILSWSAPGLKESQFRLLNALTEEKPANVDLLTFLRQCSNHETSNAVIGLLGVVENCAMQAPKASLFAAGILSLLAIRRPASTLSVLSAEPVVKACRRYVGKQLMLIQESQCYVEDFYGICQTMDFLPFLYYIADWKDAQQAISKADLLPMIAALAVNVVHQITRENLDDVPDLKNFPELMNIFLVCHHMYRTGGLDLLGALRSKPKSLCAILALEVLGRWEYKQVSVGRCQIGTSGTVQDAMKDYIADWKKIGKSSPVFQYSIAIAEGFVAGKKGHDLKLPDTESGILRSLSYRGGSFCALASCGRTQREDGSPLLCCTGGCKALARYCCAEHQKAHWKLHKSFCKR